LYFGDETVETARSAKSIKCAEREPPGDGGTSSWEDKRGRAPTAWGAFFRAGEPVAELNTREIGLGRDQRTKTHDVANPANDGTV